MSTSTKIIAVTIEPCDLLVTSDSAHIKLVRHDEVINEFFHDISLWSIKMDPPMSVSQARNKIAEITCLKSVYIHDFTFNLIGDYGVDNDFLVHRICITCDKLACSTEYKFVYMPSRFDMTSNNNVDYGPNSSKHSVFTHLESLHFCAKLLGWFNDEHYNLQDNTFICKLSCDERWNMTSKLLRYYNNYLCWTLNLQKGKGVKMDDIYIYHVHTLFLLLACLQNKHRRGRLYFQEREDDMDMNTSDTTKYNTCIYIYQVISSTTFKIYYSIIRSKITTSVFLICRNKRDTYKPRVKMRDGVEKIFRTREACVSDQALHEFVWTSSNSSQRKGSRVHVTCMFLEALCTTHGKWVLGST
jgi:hypothetical protein